MLRDALCGISGLVTWPCDEINYVWRHGNRDHPQKIGRTTGHTTGRVTAFEVDGLDVQFEMGVLRFDDQIEIEGVGVGPFSARGDSGALVIDSDELAVGLLFAGSERGGAGDGGLTYANPIGSVLTSLDASLVT